jgi:hypothetical protein
LAHYSRTRVFVVAAVINWDERKRDSRRERKKEKIGRGSKRDRKSRTTGMRERETVGEKERKRK